MATNVENNNNRTDENPASVLTSEISCTDAAPSASTDASASASASATRMSGHDDTATGATTSANASICLHRKDGPVDASDGTTGSAEEHFDFNFDGDGNQALGGMIEPREKTRQLLEISESRDSKEYLHQDSIHHVAHINRREDDDEDEAEHDAEEEEGEVENPQENGGREMQPAIELDEGEELALALAVIRRQEMFTRPGAYFVPGINYRPPGSAQPVVASAAARNSTAANNVNNVQNPTSPAEETKEEIILEGFLAPEPGERAGANGVHSSNPNRDSPEETMEQKVQRIKRHLLANAISLDDSAVRTIPMKGAQTQTKEDHELNDDEKRDVKQSAVGNEETMADQSPPSRLSTRIMKSWTDASFFHRAAFLTVVALLCTAVIIFSLGFGTGSNRSGMSPKNLDHTSVFENPCNEEPSQLEGNATIRWNIARDIVSSITPSEALQNETSPQRKALRWIVCNDAISSKFLNQHDNQTLSPNNQHVRQTHAPPPQPTQATTGYGFVNSGNSGESQILRRYILATLYYSTSIDGPWQDDWNFLNGNQHECSWHKKYKRWNFQFEEVDPAGIICQTGPWGDILLNDEEIAVGRMTVNFRIKNNLTGTLPPELGHLVDLADILIEQQEHLSGSLPPFMPNLTLIDSVSILFNGPDLGGEIPKSLLELPSFTYLTIKQNAGSWSLPENVDNISPNITNVDLSTSGFRGTIPHWIYESNVVILDLAFNEFQGAIFPEDEIIDFLPRIEFLNYHGNRHLYGTLPDALGRLGGTLKVLALGDNQIGGSLPESIGNLSNLELLSLNDNAMTGTLPATLANMTSLSHLVLSSNSFRGSVTVLESMKNLTTVLTHSNEFSGTLPGGIFDEVSSDASLYLDVGNNRFSGDIPASYGNVPNLTFFGATRNNFNDNTVHNATCDNIEFTIMDCSACSCCNVCCDASDDLNSGDICDFHMDSFRLLGLDCGPWWMYCNQPQTYYDVDPV